MIINEMQSKLARWSLEDSDRRFNRLLRLIVNKTWLTEAARITLSSSGANTPGVDGITKSNIQDSLNDELDLLRSELLQGNYRPRPVRRIYIPKANGKKRPLGIPCIRDRIVQRAMLMAMEPIWESDFSKYSYGFRPQRSVHHAIRTVKIQLTDNGRENATAGRWVIEGDLSSYFDTVHHKLLMKAVKKRISDKRFLKLLWLMLRSGHVDKNLFRATHQGVPQGGVISPLLSNIMLHEFDKWMERIYLNKKVRKDRWAWNFGIQKQRPIAIKENRQWRPAISYCRYADDFVVIVKGTKQHAKEVRELCRCFLEDELKLTLNMEKTKITHVNDGFVFLGHHIIRKRGPKGYMRVTTNIPWDRYRRFVRKLVNQLSENYSLNVLDMIDSLNRQIVGWVNFYQHTDYTACIYKKVDHSVFWKFGHWLARKFRTKFPTLMQKYFKLVEGNSAKTWVFRGRNSWNNQYRECALKRLVKSRKMPFKWKNPSANPYLYEPPKSYKESRYEEIAFAISNV